MTSRARGFRSVRAPNECDSADDDEEVGEDGVVEEYRVVLFSYSVLWARTE